MNKIDGDINLNLRIRSLSSGCMQDMARQYCCLVGAHLAKLNASRTFTGREDIASVRKRFPQQVYNIFHEQGLTFKKPWRSQESSSFAGVTWPPSTSATLPTFGDAPRRTAKLPVDYFVEETGLEDNVEFDMRNVAIRN